jgi:hypothetical protein
LQAKQVFCLPGLLYEPFLLSPKSEIKRQKLENESDFGGFQSPEVRNKMMAIF